MHRTVLVAKLVAGGQAAEQRIGQLAATFQSQGLDPLHARDKALAVLDGIVNSQASILSFGDTFFATAVLLLGTLPLVLLLGKTAKGQKVEAGH
jgi:DHA2 family multidrug resistance protein